jgi:glycosyltransferase involved in cell wall biosynthesis
MSVLGGLRLGVITPRLEPVGGTEIYVRRLMQTQRELGATVKAWDARGLELGESLHPLRRPDAAAVARSADVVAAGCDVVEFHGCAPLPLMRALAGRVPMLLFAHTSELTCPAGGRALPAIGAVCDRPPGVACLGVDAARRCLCTPDGTPFGLNQRLRAPLRGVLTRQVLDLAWGVVFNSAALERLFAETVGVPGRAWVIAPAVPEPAHAAEPAEGSLLFCGRLIETKGVLDAIAVCARLDGTRLCVAGTGPAGPRARELAHRLGVADRVEFTPWLDEAELGRRMAQSRCLLMPSRLFEAWGMAGPEAAARGCAVAAYDSGGVREWCRDPWGATAPVADVAALAAAARRGLEVQDDERRLWREQVLARWGTAAFAARYAPVVLRAAERARAGRVTRVTQLVRRPMPGFHSIENLFAELRRELPGDIEPRVRQSPCDNGGVLRRLLNLAAAAGARGDVLHVTGDSHYLALATDPRRTLLTVHDCGALLRHGGLRRALLRRLYFLAPAARVAAVTAVSAATRDQLHELAGVDSARVRVIPNCVASHFTPGPPADDFTVLMVGTLPHKNLARCVSALAGTGLTLHVVGEPDTALRGALDRAGLPWRNSVNLDGPAMARAYHQAGVLLFASTFEGFGMPIIEAQACGLPVVTSALAPMDWVAGDGALLVDPCDETAIRAAVLRLRDDPVMRQSLREAGLRNAARFAAPAVAAQYAVLYRELAP